MSITNQVDNTELEAAAKEVACVYTALIDSLRPSVSNQQADSIMRASVDIWKVVRSEQKTVSNLLEKFLKNKKEEVQSEEKADETIPPSRRRQFNPSIPGT